MTELTPEKRLELENAVVNRLCPPNAAKDDSFGRMFKSICAVAARAAIFMILEYEKMKQDEENSQ